MIDPITGILGGASILGGLFGRSGSPNKWAKGKAEEYERMAQAYLDPKNPFYSTQKAQYFKQLSQTLNESSPTTNSLLSLATAGGRSQGAAATTATLARQAIEARNRSAALQSAENYNADITRQGLGFASGMYDRAGSMWNTYASGEAYAADDQNKFASSLLNLGAGLLGNELGKTPETNSTSGNNNNELQMQPMESQTYYNSSPNRLGSSFMQNEFTQYDKNNYPWLGKTNSPYVQQKQYNPYRLGGY